MRILPLTTALILSAGAVQASSFDAFASIDIKISSIDMTGDPGGELTYLDLYADDNFTDTIVSGAATAGFTTTTTTTPADPTSVTSPSVGEGTFQKSEVEGTADFPDFSGAIASTDGIIEIENTSSAASVFSITFTVIFDLMAESISTSLDDFVDAYSEVFIDLNTDGALSDPDDAFDAGVFADWEFFDFFNTFANDDTDTDASSGTFDFTVTLDAGESLDIFAGADTLGTINSDLIPIPVGPAAPLLLGALGTFGFLRRRKSA